MKEIENAPTFHLSTRHRRKTTHAMFLMNICIIRYRKREQYVISLLQTLELGHLFVTEFVT